ncbi:hypothetical protein HAX54_006836 [Datura stramonium]|uniref:Uncharacterized protein n=1 Tax=Datura stramonium TaxID=4076 RepID=A0ABS8TC08_DATST|nr:hypothetical protein [Datura stramonium]
MQFFNDQGLFSCPIFREYFALTGTTIRSGTFQQPKHNEPRRRRCLTCSDAPVNREKLRQMRHFPASLDLVLGSLSQFEATHTIFRQVPNEFFWPLRSPNQFKATHNIFYTFQTLIYDSDDSGCFLAKSPNSSVISEIFLYTVGVG